MLDNGDLMGECCCEEGNPCDPEPSMNVTVTGASGTINWCGETWNLPGDSGDTKTVCPTYYVKQTTTGATTLKARHEWSYAGTKVSLGMVRRYSRFFMTGVAYNTVAFYASDTGTTRQDKYLWYFIGGTWNGPYTSLSQVTGVSPLLSGRPSFSSYDFGSNFFGSETVAGITYTWAKGQGW